MQTCIQSKGNGFNLILAFGDAVNCESKTTGYPSLLSVKRGRRMAVVRMCLLAFGFRINEMNFRFLMHTIIFWLSTQLNFVVHMYKSGFVRFYSTQLRDVHMLFTDQWESLEESLVCVFIREEIRCCWFFVWNMCFVFQIDQQTDRYHADKNIYR